MRPVSRDRGVPLAAGGVTDADAAWHGDGADEQAVGRGDGPGSYGLIALLRPRTGLQWLLLATGAVLIPLWGMLVAPPHLALAAAFLGLTLLTLAASDFRAFLLPNVLTVCLGSGGLAIVLLYDPEALASHLMAMATGGSLLMLTGVAYRALRGRDGLGLGDAKLLAAAGAWLTLDGLASVLFLGSLSGLAYGLLLARIKGGEAATEPVPLGAFLCLGVWITWLYGPVELMSLMGAP